MLKPHSNRSRKKMPSKGRPEPGRKKKVDEDLGRAHQEDQSDEDSDEENGNPVLNVKGSDDDDDASDDVDEQPLTGLEAKMLKQSKILRQKAELEEDDDDDEEDVKERAGKVSDIIAVEEVTEDKNSLSKEEKMDVVISDAPELLSLLTGLREGLDELRTKGQVLVENVKDGQYATKEGISYLEVKHLLLLSYCQFIIFYILLKAEGRSVRDHPVIPRLLELRLFLEKIRPIDKRLQYQIDKLLKTAISPGADYSQERKEDDLKYRPNPDLLVSKLDEDAQTGGGVYRPPMIAPVAMEEDVRPRDKRQKDRAEKESRRRASRSAFMKEMANELEGKPEEVQEIVGTESKEMTREKARLDARAKEEEELFARVPLSRVERKKLKQLKQSKSGLMDLLDDFDDGLADLVGMGDDRHGVSAGGPPDDLLKPRKLSQVIAEGGRAAKKSKGMSGEDLGGRRRKHETQGSDKDDQDFEPEVDESYKGAKQSAGMKKAAKRAKYDKRARSTFRS